MDYSFLSNLTLSQLEELKKCLKTEEESRILLSEIDKMKLYKELGYKDFSSDRIPNYKEENERYYLEIIKQMTLEEVPFLLDSLNARAINIFPIPSRTLDESLYYLENYFKHPDHRYQREGGYNTYNYVKNYIYYLLSINNNISKKDVFEQYDEKILLATEHIAEIASYLYEFLKNVDGLYLSIGRQGLANTIRRTNNSTPLSSYQERLVQAVAFGTSYEKLEARNYEDSKRLLFIR